MHHCDMFQVLSMNIAQLKFIPVVLQVGTILATTSSSEVMVESMKDVVGIVWVHIQRAGTRFQFPLP